VELSEAGIESFGGCLKALTSLAHLTLKISRCWRITDEGILHITNGIEQLALLKSLNLELAEGVPSFKRRIDPIARISLSKESSVLEKQQKS